MVVPAERQSETVVAVPDLGARSHHPDLATELLALDVKSELPAAVPPKKARRLSKKFSLIHPNQAWVMWVAVLFRGRILAVHLRDGKTVGAPIVG